jgi:polycystin 1L2
LTGDLDDLTLAKLEDPDRKLFRRDGIDTFLVTLKRPLGELRYLRIWHDNSGRGRHASWFLKIVTVYNFQLKQKSYFICEKWLSVDHNDGLIDRVLPVSTERELKEFKYLLKNQTQKKISDGHLWFSLFLRPSQSSFNRLDRLTCCFVLLFMSMLVNITYYGMNIGTNSANGVSFGPFFFSAEQVIKL